MRFFRIIKNTDEAAYNVFQNLTAWSKSLIMGGLVGAILVAVCSVVTSFYILYNGYTIELGDIFNSFIDRSAALPSIALFISLICEISSKNIK